MVTEVVSEAGEPIAIRRYLPMRAGPGAAGSASPCALLAPGRTVPSLTSSDGSPAACPLLIGAQVRTSIAGAVRPLELLEGLLSKTPSCPSPRLQGSPPGAWARAQAAARPYTI